MRTYIAPNLEITIEEIKNVIMESAPDFTAPDIYD